MSSFPLLIEDSEKAVDLPRNSLRNILIICEAMLKSGSTNLNELKDILPEIRDDKVRQPSSDYKFLTRFFDQGKFSDESDAARYEELMKGIQALCWQIEVCFKHLKSNGFKLEQMNALGKERRPSEWQHPQGEGMLDVNFCA